MSILQNGHSQQRIPARTTLLKPDRAVFCPCDAAPHDRDKSKNECITNVSHQLGMKNKGMILRAGAQEETFPLTKKLQNTIPAVETEIHKRKKDDADKD